MKRTFSQVKNRAYRRFHWKLAIICYSKDMFNGSSLNRSCILVLDSLGRLAVSCFFRFSGDGNVRSRPLSHYLFDEWKKKNQGSSLKYQPFPVFRAKVLSPGFFFRSSIRFRCKKMLSIAVYTFSKIWRSLLKYLLLRKERGI